MNENNKEIINDEIQEINIDNSKSKKTSKKQDTLKEAIEWVICTIIALIIVLTIKYFITTPTIVKMSSMYPTLKDEQRLLLNRTHRIGLNEIKHGDIITFEAPMQVYNKDNIDQSNPVAVYNNEKHGFFYNFLYYVVETPKISYIKRVIGLAGDHIEIKENKIYLNGKELIEEYIAEGVTTVSPAFTNFVVPEGYIFAVGDNRNNSVDCRSFGCIPLEKVEGTVWLRFWPFSEWTTF